MGNSKSAEATESGAVNSNVTIETAASQSSAEVRVALWIIAVAVIVLVLLKARKIHNRGLRKKILRSQMQLPSNV